MTELRRRVERLEALATFSANFGASPKVLSSFPGAFNLVAGTNVTFTAGPGTLTIDASGGGGGGTVTSVGLTLPTGLQVSGSPVTTSGTFAVTYQPGYEGYTTAEAFKLSNIAAGATVGADWNTNLSNIPANITSWAAIAPSAKQNALTSSTSNTISGTQVRRAALTGDVTASANSNATTIASGVVTPAKMNNGAAVSVLGRSANSTGVRADIVASANRTFLGRTSGALSFFAPEVNDITSSSGLVIVGKSGAGSGPCEEIPALAAWDVCQRNGSGAIVFDTIKANSFASNVPVSLLVSMGLAAYYEALENIKAGSVVTIRNGTGVRYVGSSRTAMGFVSEDVSIGDPGLVRWSGTFAARSANPFSQGDNLYAQDSLSDGTVDVSPDPFKNQFVAIAIEDAVFDGVSEYTGLARFTPAQWF